MGSPDTGPEHDNTAVRSGLRARTKISVIGTLMLVSVGACTRLSKHDCVSYYRYLTSTYSQSVVALLEGFVLK